MSSTCGLPIGGVLRHFGGAQVYAGFILAIIDTSGASHQDAAIPVSETGPSALGRPDPWTRGRRYLAARIHRQRKLLMLISGTTAAWLATVLLFAFCGWFDQTVRGSSGAPISIYLSGWAKGMTPWLFLAPLVFRQASSSRQEKLIETLRSGILCGVLCMSIVAVYASLAFSYGTDLTPFEAVTSFQLTDWMWDITFFVLLFMTGRLTRAPAIVRVSTTSQSGSIAVKSHDRVEYIQISDIQGATAQGNYIALHLPGRDVLHRATMASLTEALTDAGFVRIHRSHLVNPDLVVSAAARGDRVREVRLQNGVELPVSERYAFDVGTRLADRVCR